MIQVSPLVLPLPPSYSSCIFSPGSLQALLGAGMVLPTRYTRLPNNVHLSKWRVG